MLVEQKNNSVVFFCELEIFEAKVLLELFYNS